VPPGQWLIRIVMISASHARTWPDMRPRTLSV